MEIEGLFRRWLWVLLLLNLGLSLAFFFVFWKFFGGNLVVISQFGILGTFFTMFGYFLTIYQISQLRDEKEMIVDVQNKLNLEKFKDEVYDVCVTAKKTLNELTVQINAATEFNETNLQGFLIILNEEKNNMVRINIKYESYKHKFELPCNSCTTGLDQCILDFENIIQNREMDSFNRIKHLSAIRKIISEIITMETKIRI